MSQKPSELPKYPSGSHETLPSAPSSDEPLRQPRTLVVYALAVAGMCLVGLPFVLFSFFEVGPLAGAGALLMLGGQVWLFTQIFGGNPVAAFVVLLIPVLGSILAILFIIEHFRIAVWPVLCQVLGWLLWIGAAVSSLGRLQ
jgi:hypothetical protein